MSDTRRTIVDRVADGLKVLSPHVPDDVQVNEYGGHLHVWSFETTDFPVPPEVESELIKLGWYKSHDGVFATGLN